jgi:DME family drug/metabolite transporter
MTHTHPARSSAHIHTETRPALALSLTFFGLTLAWVFGLPLVQFLLRSGVSELELVFWRLLLAGGAFFMHAGFTSRLALDRRDASLVLALALTGITGFYAAASLFGGVSWQHGLYGLPVLLAASIWLASGQRLRKLNLVLLVVLGLYALNLHLALEPRTWLVNSLWGFAAATSVLVYIRLGRKVLGRYAPLTLHALVLPVAALALLPLVAFSPKAPLVWLALVAFTVLSSYGLHAWYYLVLRFAGMSKTMGATTVEPVASALLLGGLYAPLMHWFAPLAFGLTLLLSYLSPKDALAPNIRAKKLLLRARAAGFSS